MDVFTTQNSTFLGGLYWRSFDEIAGWGSVSYIVDEADYRSGIPLQAISRYRDVIDVFGLMPDGHVQWSDWTASGGWASPGLSDPL